MTADSIAQAINTAGSIVAGLLAVSYTVIGVASVIAALTPSPKDDGYLMAARKILDAVACNWGYAKNATDKPEDKP